MQALLVGLLLVVAALGGGENILARWGNSHTKPVTLLWLNRGEVSLDHLEPGDEILVDAFDGQKFLARESDTKRVVGWFRADPTHTNFTVTTPTSPMPMKMPLTDDEKLREQNEEDRHNINEHQRRTLPRFTATGYAKLRMPEGVFRRIQAFYEATKENTVLESFPPSMSYINHWEVKTRITFLPQQISQEVFDGMRPICEQWVQTRLSDVAVFGVREYQRGNFLRHHVDRLDTHVVSAILQISQDVEEPWPLEIFGHDGALHTIFMEPGDMVLYESATALHGRPEPLKGDTFANVFVHFMPLEGWGPFDARPHNTPPPVTPPRVRSVRRVGPARGAAASAKAGSGKSAASSDDGSDDVITFALNKTLVIRIALSLVASAAVVAVYLYLTTPRKQHARADGAPAAQELLRKKKLK